MNCPAEDPPPNNGPEAKDLVVESNQTISIHIIVRLMEEG